jgi:hypothetical protein
MDSDATALTGTNGEEVSVRDRTLADPDRRARDRAILAAHRGGQTWKQVAARFDLRERQARRAAKSAQQLEAEYELSRVDGLTLLGRIINAQVRALDVVESEMSNGDNSSARVGAARATGALGRDLRDSLAACGAIPGRLVSDPSGTWVRFKADLHEFMDAVFEAAESVGVPHEVAAEALDKAFAASDRKAGGATS